MSCEDFGDLVVDVLYGEEVEPRDALRFHRHLTGCSTCEKEYLELVETRELLSLWDFDDEDLELDTPSDLSDNGFRSIGGSWEFWPLLQKVAASVLILLGLFSILQGIGLVPNRSQAQLNEEEMTEILHKLIVARQVEDWKVIGEALLTLKEDLQAQNRLHMRAVYEDLNALEEQTVRILEDSAPGGKTLTGQ